MAKEVSDREDLVRDATNYVLRFEFRLPDVPLVLFAGQRAGGAWSLYWGQDDVLQWNADHQVRRGFWQERMLASYLGKLHFLDRSSGGRARLTRVPLEASEQLELRAQWVDRLQRIREAIAQGALSVLRQEPPEADVTAALDDWLTRHPPALPLAQHPGL